MTPLIVGLILFFAPHSIAIVNPAWRDAQVQRWGEGPWKAGYSVVAAAGLVLIIWGYGLARQAPIILWQSPEWLSHLTMVLMVPVFPLLIAAYVPGRIRTATRHPMLVAVKLWAVAHLLANGTLADLLLFGGFLAWAVADRVSLKRREPRATPRLPVRAGGDAIAIVGGLAVYAAFILWLHGWLIGRTVLP